MSRPARDRWLFIGATALACAAAPGAELVVRDVRIGLEYLPTAFDYTLTAPQGTFSGSDTFDSTYGASIGLDWSMVGAGATHGLVLGGELMGGQVSYSSGTGTMYGVRAEVGYAWQITDRWSLAGYALAGYGLMSFGFEDAAAFPTTTTSGTWLDYGGEARLQWQVTDQASVGLAAGYQIISADLSGSGFDLQMDLAGPTASLFFTWRFHTAPKPLE
jgi:hypothetical protein